MESKFGVNPKKEAQLRDRMSALDILEADINETFIRSAGKGGQHVNKVSTCVQLTHQPSGIQVTCQSARTQLLNRYLARCRLVEKLEDRVLGRESPAQKQLEKIKKQKKKRSKRSKDKHHQHD